MEYLSSNAIPKSPRRHLSSIVVYCYRALRLRGSHTGSDERYTNASREYYIIAPLNNMLQPLGHPNGFTKYVQYFTLRYFLNIQKSNSIYTRCSGICDTADVNCCMICCSCICRNDHCHVAHRHNLTSIQSWIISD